MVVELKLLEWSDEDEKTWQKRMRFGRWMDSFVAPVREMAWNWRLDDIKHETSPNGRLSCKEREDIELYLSEVLDRDIRHKQFETTALENLLQYNLYLLVQKLLKHDDGIKSVANIGAFYAYIDSVWAQAWPNKSFYAVDLVREIDELNIHNRRDNLRFVSGYALEMIESGDLIADVYCFSATAAEIKLSELRSYLRAMRGACKYVVFSEPIYPLPDGQVLDPSRVSEKRSVPAYIQPDSLPHRRGPISYVHNYKAAFRNEGYDVLHYNARKLTNSPLRWVDIVATPKLP
jgi:hypothetical protein